MGWFNKNNKAEIKIKKSEDTEKFISPKKIFVSI